MHDMHRQSDTSFPDVAENQRSSGPGQFKTGQNLVLLAHHLPAPRTDILLKIKKQDCHRVTTIRQNTILLVSRPVNRPPFRTNEKRGEDTAIKSTAPEHGYGKFFEGRVRVIVRHQRHAGKVNPQKRVRQSSGLASPARGRYTSRRNTFQENP